MNFLYISFLISLIFVLLIGNPLIKLLKSLNKGGQPIRVDSLKSHVDKSGTTTMGGMIILITVIILSLITIPKNTPLYIILFTTISFAIIGFLDDWKKLSQRNNKGISGKIKTLFAIISSGVSLYAIQKYIPNFSTEINIPFLHNNIDLGIMYWPFAMFTIIGSANAINLTDGLDSLATTSIITVSAALLISICFQNNTTLPPFITFIPHDLINTHYELSILLSIIMGSCVGFLWFNAYPARIFMGDVGSLSLGATLAIISIIIKKELFFAIASFVFVIETISVIIQISFVKITRKFCNEVKKPFLMSPIHHHFEKLGYHEVTIVIRFLIISIIAGIVAIISQ